MMGGYCGVLDVSKLAVLQQECVKSTVLFKFASICFSFFPEPSARAILGFFFLRPGFHLSVSFNFNEQQKAVLMEVYKGVYRVCIIANVIGGIVVEYCMLLFFCVFAPVWTESH